MAFNNRVIHGFHNEEDKIKFTGRNTNMNICWKCSGNSYKEIYDWLLKKDVISSEDYDPVEKYLLEQLGKTIDDYMNKETEIYDIDKLYMDGDCFLTDEAYYEIISNENGNAFYQEWDIKEDDKLSFTKESMKEDLAEKKTSEKNISYSLNKINEQTI